MEALRLLDLVTVAVKRSGRWMLLLEFWATDDEEDDWSWLKLKHWRKRRTIARRLIRLGIKAYTAYNLVYRRGEVMVAATGALRRPRHCAIRPCLAVL